MPDPKHETHLSMVGQKHPLTWCGLSRFGKSCSINPTHVTCPDCLAAYRAEVPEE